MMGISVKNAQIKQDSQNAFNVKMFQGIVLFVRLITIYGKILLNIL